MRRIVGIVMKKCSGICSDSNLFKHSYHDMMLLRVICRRRSQQTAESKLDRTLQTKDFEVVLTCRAGFMCFHHICSRWCEMVIIMASFFRKYGKFELANVPLENRRRKEEIMSALSNIGLLSAVSRLSLSNTRSSRQRKLEIRCFSRLSKMD